MAKTSLQAKLLDQWAYENLEAMEVSIESGTVKLKLGVVYRPPPSSENGHTLAGFLDDFISLSEGYATSHRDCILVGDFNCHVELPTDRPAQRFLSVLNDTNLQQHVAGPTHVSEHTLDLVISPASSRLVTRTSFCHDVRSQLGTCNIKQSETSSAFKGNNYQETEIH